MKSKIIVTLFLVGMLVISPHIALGGDLPNTYGNRLAAAERYLQVASMKDMMRDMIVETAKNFPEKIRGAYVSLMNKHIRVEILERAALVSMAKHFTVDELNALADFYGSKEGRSAMKKIGAYMGDVMPVIQQEMGRVQTEIEADLVRLNKR
jgi:hypothetical protein